MKSISDGEPIFEEHDCCAVCGGTTNIGMFDEEIPVCVACYTGGRFQGWLENEIERALEESPEYDRLPNGGFRRIKQAS